MSLDVYLCDGAAEVFSANITHNLGFMANKAGIYEALWKPAENGFKEAWQVAEVLQPGLIDMVERPSYYSEFNPPNGWGTYANFLPWLAKYLEACIENPTATVGVSR